MGYYLTLAYYIGYLIFKVALVLLSFFLMWHGIMSVWQVNGWVAGFWVVVITLLSAVSVKPQRRSAVERIHSKGLN